MSRHLMDGHHNHHQQHHAGVVDDHDSEDGQLRSPPAKHHHRRSSKEEHRSHASSNSHHHQVGGHDSHDDNDDDDDEDTTDSLEIKPPQAAGAAIRSSGYSASNRYKEKKSSSSRSERKHSSKEHRHKVSRGGGGGGGVERERGRTAATDRDHRERRHGNSLLTSHRHADRNDHRSDRHHQHMQHQQQQQHNSIRSGSGRPVSPERFEINSRQAAIDREHYRNMYKERERSEKRPPKIDHERIIGRSISPDKSDAERALEDLRSRLLSKRNKYDAEKQQRVSDTSHDEAEYRSEHRDGINKYDQMPKRMDKERGREVHEYRERSKKNVIEVIDSPENYNEMVFSDRYKDRREHEHGRQIEVVSLVPEDPELLARRAKLLDTAREMARRKELARDELEARRIMRREREVENPSETSPVPQKRKKHSNSDDQADERKRDSADGVVHVSDDQSGDEDESGSEDSDESSSHSENETDVENDGQSEGELPVSPLSVGELSKSERRRRSQSRSHSRSVNSKSHSRSRSPSQSRSRSRTASRSKSRSRSPSSDRQRKRTPSTDFEEVEQKPAEPTPEELAAEVAAAEAAAEALLPSYYPGVQGCRSVEEFQCLNRIEEGTYGVVYRARDKRTDEIVALKRLKMEKEKDGFPITSLREINTLLKGQHPNIVTVREIVVGSNMDKIFIVMDYVEHDLKSLMETMRNRKKSFLPGEVKCLTQQLLRAVGHLHDNWILHRDLKTSNLLLSHRGILKVGDFGLAREYGSPLKPYTSIVVTLWYRAPELLLCCTEYSHPIDMWSVGCIFAEFLAMGALFPGKSEVDQLSRIFKDLGTPNEKIWPGYNELPAVQKMTFADYPVSNLRRKFAHLTSELGLGLLQGLLTYDPKQRLSAEQGLRHPYFKEQPLPIDPAMFPTWPAKSELGARKALASSPKPPSGGGQFKQLVETEENHGFVLNAMSATGNNASSSLQMGPGFSLKF